MRYLFLLLALAGLTTTATAPVRAQSGSATAHGVINWGGTTEVPSRSNRKQQVPTFVGAYYNQDDQVGIFSLRLAGQVLDGQLTNTVYEPFSAAEAKKFNLSKLPAGPTPTLRAGTEMKQPVTHLSLGAVRRNSQTGQPERLVSFDYVYSPITVAARGGRARGHREASVLKTGDWYKIGVAESGVYRLDFTTLRSMGLNVQGIDQRRIKVYGNSMGILPQLNSTYRPDDLAENAVMYVGNSGNTFDASSSLLFYSPGAHTWEYANDTFQHRNNIYCDTTYYFITVGDTPNGRRVSPMARPATTGSEPSITTFTDRYFYEHDLASLLYSGREWVGDGFSAGTSKNFTFSDVPDLIAGSTIRVKSAAVSAATQSTAFQLTLNGQALGTQTLASTQVCSYCPVAMPTTNTYQTTVPAGYGNSLQIGISYNSGSNANAYLDYLEIIAQRQLRLSGTQLEFRSVENVGPQRISRFVLSNATDAVVWDVTNPRNAQAPQFDAATGEFWALTDSVREYVAFRPNGTLKTVRSFGRVANQDLHSLNSNGLLDLVIVTYPPFKAQAERLAEHRRTHNNMQVAVVTTTEVYNEYSSGGQDITAIRDLMKQVYDRAPAGKHLFLLLFGDASYDYKSDPMNDKNAEPAWWSQRVPFKNTADFDRYNQNYVPTYESRESFIPFYSLNGSDRKSYSSDDYFGFLDDNEGEWAEPAAGFNELQDIGVGRLPIRTPVDNPRSAIHAEEMVTKVLAYDAVASFGKWRNRVTLTSDDGDGGIFALQQTTGLSGSDEIANRIEATYPVYNIHKTYLDMYPQVSVAAGQRSPECSKAIDASFEQGSLIVNYLGHGGPKGLTDEQIVTNASVMALRNLNNLAFMVTGTCDFSTYDSPDMVSAGEQVLTDNLQGGAIGLFTTTRVVDANLNAGLNKAFYNRLFQRINNEHPSIATITMLSKNDYTGGGANNRNYTLLADPSMVLAYPEDAVTLDSISRHQTRNGVTTWVASDTLKALTQVRLKGRVLDVNGNVNTAFNGTAQITIFDKPTTVKTFGDEYPRTRMPGDSVQNIKVQENVVYGGQATVVNGYYTVTFVVPKDINYNPGLGKVSLYAFDPSQHLDAHGYRNAVIGGSGSGSGDNQPPVIGLFMDDESFVFGGTTAQNTTLLGDLSDENGINTTGAGIGHEITATLDNDPSKVVILNDSYVAKVDTFTAGRVKYLFKNLTLGPHVLRVKAWDTYNNSSEKEIEFVVSHNEQLAINHVLNYPNPFAGNTTFMFDHNRAGDDLDVQVQIFTVAGKLVRTLRSSVVGSDAHQKGLTWNGRDEYDDQLARGVYIYRVSVRSPNNGTASKFEKLVILN
jgi:hypothetical protein